jgi:protein O-GlcNAc transferase
LHGHGHVWAFEPTSEPLHRLRASVRANGLQERITVVGAGLADTDGEASFAVQDNSELNSRSGTGSRRETVRLLALDGYLARARAGAVIDFVKLDAEGDEINVLAGAQRSSPRSRRW